MENKRHVLISPLGRSPGAVSGVYFELQRRGIQVSEVITVGTSHDDVRQAADVWLTPLFAAEPELTYRPRSISSKELRGKDRAMGSFTALMGHKIQQAHDANHVTHVAVTGGRSGMGALAALAAQLYGADHLWHLWVDPEIERNGTIDRLDPPVTRANVYLNPTVRQGAVELVALPFVDMTPLHGVIREYLSSGFVPDTETIPYNMFVRTGVKHLGQVFPPGITVQAADRITELVEAYGRSKKAKEQHQIFVELGHILQDTGVYDEKVARRMQTLITQTIAPDTIKKLIAEAKKGSDYPSLWERFIQGMTKHKDAIDTGGKLLLNISSIIAKWQEIV
jgi:hypothetical protein